MYDWIVAHQALIREVINGFCMVLFLVLTVLVMIFMWDAFVTSKTSRWTNTPGVPTACALWWVFAAESYRTGAIWWLYNVGKDHHTSPYPTASSTGIGVFGDAGFMSTFGYLVAGVMLIFGLQRSIYIFTPPEWKRKIWLQATIAAGAFCLFPSVVRLVARYYIYGI